MFTRRKYINLIGLALLTMVASACSSLPGPGQPVETRPEPTATVDSPTPPAVVSHGNEIGGYVDFVDALRAAGATVEPIEEVEQAFFSVKGQKISVNGAEIQVFEYENEAARESDSDLISTDGTNVGTSMITWVDQPNFWGKGRIIALYVGKDQALIDLLNGVLGEPITKHP
jgi:hypothetical protein